MEEAPWKLFWFSAHYNLLITEPSHQQCPANLPENCHLARFLLELHEETVKKTHPPRFLALTAVSRNTLIQRLVFNLATRQLNSIPNKVKRWHKWNLMWLYNSSLWSEMEVWKTFTSFVLLRIRKELKHQSAFNSWHWESNATLGTMIIWTTKDSHFSELNLCNSHYPTKQTPPPQSPPLRNWFLHVSSCRSFRFGENMSFCWS